jgi:hypothetical protein
MQIPIGRIPAPERMEEEQSHTTQAGFHYTWIVRVQKTNANSRTLSESRIDPGTAR